jgi:hypothetical protein
MQLDALRGACDSDVVMRRPGLALAKGLQAFAAGHYAAALANLRVGRGELMRIGGSHAQRDVFERIAVDAAIRSGALAEAQELLVERDARRGARDGFAIRRAQVVDELTRAAEPAALNRLA